MSLGFLNYQLETFLCIDFNVFTVGRDYIWETAVLIWCKLIIRTDKFHTEYTYKFASDKDALLMDLNVL